MGNMRYLYGKMKNYQETKKTLNASKILNIITVQAIIVKQELNIWAFIGI